MYKQDLLNPNPIYYISGAILILRSLKIKALLLLINEYYINWFSCSWSLYLGQFLYPSLYKLNGDIFTGGPKFYIGRNDV
jgi:hypothetical protein